MRYVVLDVDGVLADFVLAFTRMGNIRFGTPVYSNGRQRDWRRFEGLTPAQIDALWDSVRSDNLFWESLPELVTPGDKQALRVLSDSGFSLLYLTLRPGVEPALQTRHWLLDHDFPAWDQVAVTDDKVAFLREFVKEPDVAVGILEDRPGELARMTDAGLPVTARDWPYNRGLSVPRVYSVAEFADKVLRAGAVNGH